MDVLHEIGTHRAFCETFDVTLEELEKTPEATQTTAYGAYIVNIGLQGKLRLHRPVPIAMNLS